MEDTLSKRELRLAARNASKLGAALMVTWVIGLGIRLLLPRFLNPEGFGAYQFADTYTASVFAMLSLGVETLIQKEAATDPKIVLRIGGGLMIVRLLLGIIMAAGAMISLILTGHPSDSLILVACFSFGQLAIYDASFLQAALQAAGRVDKLSLLNIGAKVIWGGWLLSCMMLKTSVQTFALAFAISEMGRAIALHKIARHELDFHVQINFSATRAAIIAALPFYLNSLVLTLSNKLDVSLLGFLVNDNQEIGYFSAANTLAGMAMLLIPVLMGVVTPMLNRALARSREEFFTLVSHMMHAAIQIAIPATLVLFLGADFWVWLAFGKAYAPAAMSLRTLSPIFSLTYVAFLGSVSLNALGRGWMTVRASLIGLIACVGITLVLTRPLHEAIGIGGAGIGPGIGAIGMEAITASIAFAVLGKHVLTPKFIRASLYAAMSAIVAMAVHRILPGPDALRLFASLTLYTGLIFGLGVVTREEVKQVIGLWR